MNMRYQKRRRGNSRDMPCLKKPIDVHDRVENNIVSSFGCVPIVRYRRFVHYSLRIRCTSGNLPRSELHMTGFFVPFANVLRLELSCTCHEF